MKTDPICKTAKIHVLALAICLLPVGIVHCSQQRTPVNRVQPYAIEKASLVGPLLQDPSDNPEFWTQGTIIDVDYGASGSALYTSSYAQRTSRIRWDITEDLLLGRLAYERIEGTDGKGAGTATNDGVVVVAFQIEKHFDISRDYNPTTGEELNIVNENDRDRPWYERAHMRVDWSKNLHTDNYDFDTLSLIGVMGSVEYEPLALQVSDPRDPNAPHFALEEGYFDVTNKAFAKPATVDRAWGTRPACYYGADLEGGTGPGGSCSPIEITVRHAFRKVETSDYEPLDWDGIRFKAFGAFTVERKGYARNYGMSDNKWRRFITRYHIWERKPLLRRPRPDEGPHRMFYTGDNAGGIRPKLGLGW